MEITPELIAAKELAEPEIMAIPGVIGVGIGMREQDGELFDEEIGTVGALVEDTRNPGTLLGLSNFHVVGDVGVLLVDTIWQPNEPPLVIGFTPSFDDNIGTVARASFPQLQPIPFVTVAIGLVDAAVFSIDVGQGLAAPGPLLPLLGPAERRTTAPKIVGQGGPGTTLISRVTATAAAEPGVAVRKRGFATRVTSGRIIDPAARYTWPRNNSDKHLIEQMLIAGSPSNPDGKFCSDGDSGSLVIDESTSTAIGLLWGGMSGGVRGIACAIRNVESQLDVRVAWAP